MPPWKEDGINCGEAILQTFCAAGFERNAPEDGPSERPILLLLFGIGAIIERNGGFVLGVLSDG